ncbi:MAG: glutaredoxin family protein [Actinomycetota bacterium]|nr:glutaredoxin family protein [Actinomycetota bacterium]
MIPKIHFYTRSGCHLCDEAEQALVRSGLPFIRVDIAGSDQLEMQYGLTIPVVEVSGSKVFEAGDDPDTLASAISGAIVPRSL